jgi:iron-sulfur cluster repair protein YtfE (RIC family)
MGNLKSNMTKEEWSDLQKEVNSSHSDQVIDKMNNDKDAKVTRLEVINHATNNGKPTGRILTMYKELGHFTNIELDYQDGGRTLKIFLV